MFVKGGVKSTDFVHMSEEEAKYVGNGHTPALMERTITVIPKQKVHKETNSFGTECRCIFANVYTLDGKYVYTQSMYVSAFQRKTFGTEAVEVLAIEATTKTGKKYIKGEYDPQCSNINVPLRVGKIEVEGIDGFILAITEDVAYRITKGALHYMPEFENKNNMVSMVKDNDHIKLVRRYLPEITIVTELPEGSTQLPEELKSLIIED